ncbi:hypothetical protein GCM10023114_29620 [Mycolicibacterium sediminis]|uniref:Uncharacterized protein n=1 Tax=Mycolicibacterium sediminis TaxID=1286180 RepID=A0A7I7QYM2_9MYCO|nr:hypothetical protein MSEDJ_50460 [Mycolicibacterium sediminis]
MVRVDVDPSASLSAAQLRDGMARLAELAADLGADVVAADLASMPADRRQVEVLISGNDPDALQRTAMGLCVRAFGDFGAEPSPGVLTYVSRGTDDDAHGVLAGMGLSAEVERTATDAGWDLVTVTLTRSDLTRVPESRVHTALEASLNCEVRIVVT